MKNQSFYMLTLDDYASPAQGARKPYFGTMDDIDAFMKAIRKTCIGSDRILHKVKVKDIASYHKGISQTLSDRSWLYKSSQGNIYELHADKIEIEQISIKYDGYYQRCMKVRFTNLAVEEPYTTERYIPVDLLLGHPQVFKIDFGSKANRIIESRFFVSEDSYNTLKESKERMAEQYLSFDSLMDDIFGDN